MATLISHMGIFNKLFYCYQYVLVFIDNFPSMAYALQILTARRLYLCNFQKAPEAFIVLLAG
jgi:hypothetical protein